MDNKVEGASQVAAAPPTERTSESVIVAEQQRRPAGLVGLAPAPATETVPASPPESERDAAATQMILPVDQPELVSAFEGIPELRPHINAARTFGFLPPVSVQGDESVMWITRLNDQALELPHLWIKGPKETRFFASRQMIRQLLDRLCGSVEPPPKTVIVVAHPDDEAVGAGARLRDLTDSTLVYVTDGAPRDPEYALRRGFATREAYAQTRQAELKAALSLVGISAEQTRCLNVVDGEAAHHLIEVTYRLAELFDELRPEVVLTHPYEGGHTDHDASAFAVHLACGILRREGLPAPVVIELTSYHFYEGRRRIGQFLPFYGVEERTIELEASAQALKHEMYDRFVSQQACLADFGTDKERFRAAPRYVFELPPHEGPLLYERFARAFTGAQWRDGAKRALGRLRARKREHTAKAASS